jgi:hypothetical protein
MGNQAYRHRNRVLGTAIQREMSQADAHVTIPRGLSYLRTRPLKSSPNEKRGWSWHNS